MEYPLRIRKKMLSINQEQTKSHLMITTSQHRRQKWIRRESLSRVKCFLLLLRVTQAHNTTYSSSRDCQRNSHWTTSVPCFRTCQLKTSRVIRIPPIGRGRMREKRSTPLRSFPPITHRILHLISDNTANAYGNNKKKIIPIPRS